MAKKKSKPETEPVAEPAPVPKRTVLFSRSLRVRLSDREVADRADRAAHKLADVVEKKEELKASTKHQKAIIESIEAEVHQLSAEVREHSTYRMVECQTEFDYERSTVREVRLDTNEVLDERRMTEAERQRELPFEQDGQAEAPEANEGGDDADEGDDF